VTIFARPSSPLAGVRSRVRAALILALGITTVLLAATAAPAQAVVVSVGAATTGVQPRVSWAYVSKTGNPLRFEFTGKPGNPGTYSNPAGNPVLHGTNTYAVYWDPTDNYHGDWQNVIDEYLQKAATASGTLSTAVFAVDAQYTDKTNVPASYQQVFKGAYTDTTAYPASECEDPHPFAPFDRIGLPTVEEELFGEKWVVGSNVCLTSAQIASRLEGFLAAHSLPKGLGNVYYVLTPPGVTVCLDGGGPKGHCSDYQGNYTEVEEAEAEREEAEAKKEAWVEPAQYKSYANSFCSYHAAINPGALPTGDGNTIVYGVVPWTAGGYGDGHLELEDQTPGWECQDGGYDPSSKPVAEKREKAKEENATEKEEFEKKSTEEKQKALEAKVLEGPHEQEPNQIPCPTQYDGTCDHGLADLIINQLSLEQQNIVTDPLLNAWQDANNSENTDECRFLFALSLGGSSVAQEASKAGDLFNNELDKGTYYLNDAFNLAALRLPYPGVGCLNHVNLEAVFNAPSTVNSGETVGFAGMESNITLDAAIGYSGGGSPQANYATYTWNFGDGSPVVSGFAPGAPACETPWLSPCAASEFHSYQYGGTYDVTLTVKDVAGNSTSTTHPVTVVGPPPPGAPGTGTGSEPGTGVGAGAGSGAGSVPGAAGAGSSAVPAPVAAYALVSKSLRKATRHGLVIRYSVNEQVAGHFEVLLSRSLARRLKIHGARAVGLPKGTPAQVVIAKAFVVTTKGGHSKIRIKFPKRTARRLAKRHKVSLMLRLAVRNASRTPTTTTVLSRFTLVH
jgi:PKD domain